MSDEIQKAISSRAEDLGLTAYAIAKQCDGKPSKDAVNRYLRGDCALNSRYVSAICKVLGLELRVAKKHVR